MDLRYGTQPYMSYFLTPPLSPVTCHERGQYKFGIEVAPFKHSRRVVVIGRALPLKPRWGKGKGLRPNPSRSVTLETSRICKIRGISVC